MAQRRSRVRGFHFAGVHCGIKQAGARDVALVSSDRPAAVAGVFTRSTVPGAPVVLCKRKVKNGWARGVVVNAGISNVAMGARGLRDARAMAARAAAAVGCSEADMLVASTGVIGVPLPMAKIENGIAQAAKRLGPDGLAQAADAIRTTDTVAKTAYRRRRVGERFVNVAGMAKGSGMIEPRMATMLAFVVTDAAAEPDLLRGLWREVTEETFNRVTVDGETSTSDMAIVMANGACGGRPLRSSRGEAARRLRTVLLEVCTELAKDLARDGEGATKLVTIEVSGARTPAEAERAGRRIANSMLVKTALFGRDPNWGRILQTVGAGEIRLDLARTEVDLCGVPVFRNGASTGEAARRRAGSRMAAPEIEIRVHLAAGRAKARFWTCDLSYDYVRINAEYTT
ncbi:MAG: bifunctional glutamate N-acetyltransferase/amino-acid acetyltransferase ArgJ [Deltaproteobacteria bacterium]|nr:bifunctional glutamate N-acetyltransferase/amino-acid acetyltransferase ArgJ [Deltaproteobacteria bacterium]MBW2393101.1 bifunctional glutamate N-acetyltransferase/amino-acid acetyltransferase ArgJ [Deltaproteobacteria bacterium]